MSSGDEDDLASSLAFVDSCAGYECLDDGTAGAVEAVDARESLDFLAQLDGAPLSDATLEHDASLHEDADDARVEVAALDALTPALQGTDRELVRDGNDSARRAGSRKASSKAKSKRKRPPTYNSNHARQAQHKELQALRAQAQGLKLILSVLHAKQMQQSSVRLNDQCQHVGSSARGNSKSPRQQQAAAREAAVWREIAGRQMEHRVAAESERRRLKRMMETQEKIIEELQKLVFCRAMAKAMSVMIGDNTSLHPLVQAAHHFDPKEFGPIMQQVEASYRDIDRVFLQDVGQDRGVGSKSRRAHMRADADGHLYFQIFGSKIFPFDVQTTGDAAWKRFSYSIRPNDANIFSKFFDAPDDTVAELFATELRLHKANAVLVPTQIKRLFKKRDRVTVVWQSRVNAVEFMGCPLSGAEYRESGYFLIERPPLTPEGFAVLRTCYIIAPTVPTHLVPQGSVAFALMKFVFKWMAATIPVNHQILEDMLILSSTRSATT